MTLRPLLASLLAAAGLFAAPAAPADEVVARPGEPEGPRPASSLTRLHADDVPWQPRTALGLHFLLRDRLVPDLTPDGFTFGHELLGADTWDFSGNFGDSVASRTTEPSGGSCWDDECGFSHPGVDSVARIQAPLSFFAKGSLALDWDGVDTLWMRGAVVNEGASLQTVLCADPDTGRPAVPWLRFPGADVDGPFLQAGDAWSSAGWTCEPVAWFFGGACNPGIQAEASENTEHLGGMESEVRSSGVVILPSGHHLNAMLIYNRWSMALHETGCGPDFGRVEQLIYDFHVPKLGVVATLGTNRAWEEPEAWLGAIWSTFGHGLYPPLDTWVEENGNGWVRIAWDPGRFPEHVERWKVYWDTDSGADSEYAFDSDSFPALVTFDGYSATIQVPDCAPRYFSVTALTTHLDEDSGLSHEYESLKYPEQVFGDPDFAYPQEVVGRSAGDQAVTITSTPDPPALCGPGSITLTATPGFVEYRWSDGQTGPSVVVTADSDTSFGVEAIDAEGCAPVARIDVRVDLAPDFVSVSGSDADPCGAGLELRWDPAVFHGPDGTGVYHVYRSEVSCDDALAAGPVASGLTGTSWFDASTIPGVAYHYVVEAEDSRGGSPCADVGPSFGGAVTRVCVDPPIVDFEDTVGPNTDVGWTLRASDGTEDSVFFYWTDPGLVDGERFRVGRSTEPVNRPFEDISRGPMRDPDFLDRRAPDALYFYDVRVVDGCGNWSDD